MPTADFATTASGKKEKKSSPFSVILCPKRYYCPFLSFPSETREDLEDSKAKFRRLSLVGQPSRPRSFKKVTILVNMFFLWLQSSTLSRDVEVLKLLTGEKLLVDTFVRGLTRATDAHVRFADGFFLEF